MKNPVITQYKNHTIATYMRANGSASSLIIKDGKYIGASFVMGLSELTSVEKAHSKIDSY